MTKHRFQDRFIAFADILGFSGIVERMSADERLFFTVRDALTALDRAISGLQIIPPRPQK